MSAFEFVLNVQDGRARAGVLPTGRGAIETPTFMPVGTAGTVKGLMPAQVREAGARIILGNTYHLMLRPGAERVRRLGGLHQFMGWDGPILTDSGGFQVMSLSGLRKLSEAGVSFRSHIDGSTHELSPERAIEIQSDLLGADIAMQLDECPALPAPRDDVERAMELSLRWAERCKRAFGAREAQALFGIVQGGVDLHLRERSARALLGMGFDGYALGGLAVGESREEMCAVLDAALPLLPADRVRYVMGIGKPTDLIEAVWRGADIFDCVLPTRSGRHGQAFTDDGPITLTNARYAEDTAPLDPQSSCPASRDYSKAYLHHLFKAGELLGQVLLSWHNIAYFEDVMRRARAAILADGFDRFREDYLERQRRDRPNARG